MFSKISTVALVLMTEPASDRIPILATEGLATACVQMKENIKEIKREKAHRAQRVEYSEMDKISRVKKMLKLSEELEDGSHQVITYLGFGLVTSWSTLLQKRIAEVSLKEIESDLKDDGFTQTTIAKIDFQKQLCDILFEELDKEYGSDTVMLNEYKDNMQQHWDTLGQNTQKHMETKLKERVEEIEAEIEKKERETKFIKDEDLNSEEQDKDFMEKGKKMYKRLQSSTESVDSLRS